MLGGALIPGKPVANMYFTMYGYNPVVQALNLLRDLKLVSEGNMYVFPLPDCSIPQGQYCKLPPRVTFVIQVIGTIVVSISIPGHLYTSSGSF